MGSALFMNANELVMRKQTGKVSVSPEKQLQIEQAVTSNLGGLKRGFDSGEIYEDMIENADKTHLVFNMDNVRKVGFRGDENEM